MITNDDSTLCFLCSYEGWLCVRAKFVKLSNEQNRYYLCESLIYHINDNYCAFCDPRCYLRPVFERKLLSFFKFLFLSSYDIHDDVDHLIDKVIKHFIITVTRIRFCLTLVAATDDKAYSQYLKYCELDNLQISALFSTLVSGTK